MTDDLRQNLPTLLCAHEVAQILQLRVSSIYDAVAKGRLPAVKLWQGRRRAVIRFRREDIEQFIERQRTIPAELKNRRR